MNGKRLFSMAWIALVMLYSCSKARPDVKLGELTGYATHPFASIKAFDVSGSQGNWVEGVVDDEARTVDFRFHSLTDFTNVLVKVVMEETWSSMVSPDTMVFRANLAAGNRITVNDGVDNVVYALSGREYPLIEGADIVLASGERVSCVMTGLKAAAKSQSHTAWSALKNARVELKLGAEASLVSPSAASLSSFDFSSGATLSVVCKDNINNKQKTYTLSAFPADVAAVDDTWTDVTKSSPWKSAVQSDYTRIYKTTALFGYAGNVGYLFTLPAGQVRMKVLDKSVHLGGSSKISKVVRGNRDWSVFIPEYGPGVWKLSQSGAQTYYSPLAYGADASGSVRALRAEGFGGNRSNGMFAPAIGLKDGKVRIRPAATKADGRLYHYGDLQGAQEEAWDAECAFGGMFQLVKDGTLLIASEGESFYEDYNNSCRRFKTLYQYQYPYWEYRPVTQLDRLRTGRVVIGCTEAGDLIILAIEKFVNTHNQGQAGDAGHDGMDDSDRRGLTFYEVARVMKNLGCSDVMTTEELHSSYPVLQDGSDRGLDFFKTNNRYDFSSGSRKSEDSENVNLAIVCFK